MGQGSVRTGRHGAVAGLSWLLAGCGVIDTDYGAIEDGDYGDGMDQCQTCGGDGIEDCNDSGSSEGCWERGCNDDWHTCPNCKGSGLAKDQWYW
jgi:hypothetical protein